jgi:hypothetical protein
MSSNEVVPGELSHMGESGGVKSQPVPAAAGVKNAMSTTTNSSATRPARFGLAAKLFAILLFMGAVAVLITSVLGYMRARDALEETIYHQLTAARQTKARQVESYFRTIRNELRLLASTQMVVDATREFRSTFSELEQKQVPDELRRKVEDWYAQNFLPMARRLLSKDVPLADYLPVGPAATYLQYCYIVANPQPPARRKVVDDAGDGSAYSAVHALYHPLLRTAGSTLGVFDFMIADPKSGRLIYAMDKEVDFATSLQKGPYRRSNLAAAVARCSGTPDPSLTCLEDFAPYLPSDGQPIAFMAAPVIDQGAVIGVLIAQLSIEEIDRVVTGDRQWRDEGFGATGEAYIIGPDSLVRSGLRLFFEDRDRYLAELKEAGNRPEEIDAIRRYGSPVLHQLIDTQATRAALAGIEGTGQVIGSRGKPTLASWGPLAIPGVKWALGRQDRDVGSVCSNLPAAARSCDRRSGCAAGGDRDRRLVIALADGAAARAHGRRAPLRLWRLFGEGSGAHARRDRPALFGLQRHGRRIARKEHRHREQEP